LELAIYAHVLVRYELTGNLDENLLNFQAQKQLFFLSLSFAFSAVRWAGVA